MNRRSARRSRAWVVSGIVATAVVLGGGGPAPGQVPDPDGPEVVYLDAFGPMILGYEDCDGVVHTEEDPVGWVFVELDYEVEADVAVGLSFTDDLADDLVDAPTEVVVAAGEAYGEVEFALDELETGELTVAAEPGLGYTTGPDDTYTLEITDDVEIVASCTDDLGDPPNGTDRQTIDVGERPVPIGFFDEDEDSGEGEGEGSGETTTSEVEASTTAPVEISAGFARIRSMRAAPAGYDTPIANGTLPPGLTYVDDEWGGAATTPGTYAFDVRICLDQTAFSIAAGRQGGLRRPLPRAFPDVICFGQVDVQIVVLPVDPPSATPPAQPVRTTARFAG
jgi:hypothetical protein